MKKRYNTLFIDLLLAAVVCLVVNFSYLLAIGELNSRDAEAAPRWLPEGADAPHTGLLRISPDGYGYIRCDDLNDDHTDSIYVAHRLIRRLGLQDGDYLKVVARSSPTPGANQYMWRVMEIDGVPFDYGVRFGRPDSPEEMARELVFYFALAFLLLAIMTFGTVRWWPRAVVAVAAAGVVVWLIPGHVSSFDLLKCSFVLVLALLYGKTWQLIRRTEQLHSENIAARLNTLVGQTNPHFLFNSLNSLSVLVREGRSDDAITYIDRLSETFRYTIRGEADQQTTLAAELEFVENYKYLLEVRYAGKLFIDIDVEPDKLEWPLPVFSIQPLVENAVKHNAITRARPLRISIRTQGPWLVVSNPINPKIEPESGTGIGLANLSKRWQLLMGRQIEVANDGAEFIVRLPL